MHANMYNEYIDSNVIVVYYNIVLTVFKHNKEG